jgi:alanyl-tRNA synthetase
VHAVRLLDVELRHAAGVVGREPDPDPPPPDVEVGVVVHLLSDDGDLVHAAHRGGEVGERIGALDHRHVARPPGQGGERADDLLVVQTSAHLARVARGYGPCQRAHGLWQSRGVSAPTHTLADGRRVVVAAAVERDGRLLAARRTRPESVAGGWELPGGKVEPGEDPARALVRELREELAVDAEVVGAVPGPDHGDWPLDDAHVLRVLRVRLERGDPQPGVAHDAVRWLGPREVGDVAWLGPDAAPAAAAVRRLDTWVDFPAGAIEGRGIVLGTLPLAEGRTGVVVDRTPFHPLDHGWPDQPGDVGTLGGLVVTDSLTGAIDDAGALLVHDGIDVRRGDPSRTWVVVHVVEGRDLPLAGDEVRLVVDAAHREALSRGHSACHLAALALNEATAAYWSKEPPRRDSRGFPFLDQIAVQVSRIEAEGSYDAYRCGRSLRKAGFDAEAFLARREEVAERADALLAAWVATGAPSRVETGGDPTLSARRRWWCDVPGGPAVIPCGGTHVPDLGRLSRVRVEYRPTDEGFEVLTRVG